MSNFRAHLHDVKQQAKDAIGRSHVSNDLAELITELLNCISELERQSASNDKGGDLRILRSRNEALTEELRKAESALKSFKAKVIESLASEGGIIRGEAHKIIGVTPADNPVHQCAKLIGSTIKSLVEKIAKA